jgi:hypothetical protein
MTRILLALLAFYRRWLSPALHTLGTGGCKYLPTCSEYAMIAIQTHGPLRGSGLALWRLLRCHPFTPGGLDPVPLPTGKRHANCCGELDSSSTNNAQPSPLHHEPLP